eukprot:m.143472 g.143472  ORF g.143472 m.143472 type:complete len:164 (-) comp16018_c0_seq13:327-818(-)
MYMCCLLASRSKDSVIDVDQVFDAIERDDIDAVKVAVAHGFDPASHQDESGELAFHLAASAGAIRVVRYFVEVLHMDVDVLHSDGSTPIIVAAWHGHKVCSPGGRNAPLYLSRESTLPFAKYWITCNLKGQTCMHVVTMAGMLSWVQSFGTNTVSQFAVLLPG